MLKTNEIVDNLGDLLKLDVDAIRAYDDAIKNIDLPDVQNQLRLFQTDHQRHVSDLSDCIRKLGMEPPKATPDVKGFFIQGMTKIQSAMGNEQALKAMRTNEQLTNKNYGTAIKWDVPSDVKDLLVNNYNDERRHLNYIEQCINNRVWEMAPRRKTA